MPSGWPSAMAPPLRLTRGSSSACRDRALRPALRGKGFVYFNHIHCVERSPAGAALWLAGTGPMPMTAGSTPAAADNACTRCQAMVFDRCRIGDDERGRLIDPAGIAGGDRAILAERCWQFGKLLQCRCGRGCSSRSTVTGSPLRCGISTGVISRASRPLSIAAPAFAAIAGQRHPRRCG